MGILDKTNEKIPFNAIRMISVLQTYGYEAYLVGGCVRDLILGLKPNDWDICTSATPEQIIEVLKANRIKYHTVGIEFGTVTALVHDKGIEEYEITTYRAESDYSDGRHPDKVKFVRNIIEDLKRRDFTANAMAYDPINHILIDEFNGIHDLRNKIIRAVGNADERITEDPLRILRAIRIAIKLGAHIEHGLMVAMNKHKQLLDNVSKERITAELEKVLTCGKDIRNIFSECKDIIGVIIPELVPTFDFDQNNKYHIHDVYNHILYVVDYCKTNKFEIKLAALMHDIGKPNTYVVDEKGCGHFYTHPEISWEITKEVLDKRLRLTREQADRVLELVKYHDIMIADTKASLKRMLNKHGEDWLRDWFILKQADMDDHVYPNKSWKYYMDIPKLNDTMQSILDENACFKVKDLKVNGNILMKELNIKPGKQIGIILNTLLNEVIDEKISNDYDILIARALELNS